MAKGINTNVNSKASVGRARKAENEARKASEQEARKEAQEALAWKEGADLRSEKRAAAAADRADEAARKRREKALLEAQEQASLGSGGKAKTAPKSVLKKKKDDLSLLENSLVKDAEKKLRAKREREEQLKREGEETERRKKEEENQKNIDPLLLNTQAMLGGSYDSNRDDNEITVGRKANKVAFEENEASGLDAALNSLNVGGGSEVKSMKALYAAYEARLLPNLKVDHPGLRLTQYRERIFQMWQKAPENPANQQHP